MAKLIDEDTRRILSRVTIDGVTVFLTCGQLDRKQYQAVNDVLTNIGGKWDRKPKGHVFASDPSDSLEQVLLSGEITKPEKYGYFPTPPEVARKLVGLAGVEPGMSVLEPEAGQGGIADHLPAGCSLDCIEFLSDNVKVLEGKGYKVTQGDFLSVEPKPLYHRVVMNPPFERQADIDHVKHAWDCVQPGGRLAAIMSTGILFRENKKTIEFRAMVDEYGYVERLPENSFKSSGTSVSTCMVVMDKPGM
jgi:hypothetical protein